MSLDGRDKAFLRSVGRDAGMVLCAAVLGWSAGPAGVLVAVGIIFLVYAALPLMVLGVGWIEEHMPEGEP